MGGKYYFDKYTPAERKALAEECGLTEEEEQIFEIRARTDRVVGTQMRLSVCESTVKRRSRSIAQKLARCGHRRHMSPCLQEKYGV